MVRANSGAARAKGKLRRTTLFDIVNATLLGLIGFSMLYPILNLLITSFSSITDVMASHYGFLLPKSIDLDAYRYILKFSTLWNAYGNTIHLTLVGTSINLFMSTLSAYVLSERRLPGRGIMMTFVLITMFFSGGLIPSFILISRLGMVNTLWALMIPGAISTWNMIIMRNFFQGISESIKESARIDGAGEIMILIRIILPLSPSVLATMALFYGVGHWNQYSSAIIYLNNPSLYPLQVVIRQMYAQAIQEIESDALPPPVETVRAAAVMLALVPVLCVYPFLQKYFVKGIMVGALKE